MATTMWEVRAADGAVDELLTWVQDRAADAARIYRSDGAETRVVVIDESGRAAADLADVPANLVARPAHVWDFEPVPRA